MKKYMFSILLFMMLIPFAVNAKESCTIVSGNGKDIGSEIACGTEHFYIIEKDEDSIKMLSKYNLEVGLNYNKVDVTEDYNENTSNSSLQNYCYSKYNTYAYEEMNEKKFCIASSIIENPSGIQNSRAIGAHGTKEGNPDPEEYGVILLRYTNNNFLSYGTSYGNGYYVDGVLNPNVTSKQNNNSVEDYETIYPHLQYYKNYLISEGFSIANIDIISVSEINDLVKKISGRELPLEEWDPDNWNDNNNIISAPNYSGSRDFLVGSIKDNLPDGYDWIYSTTYWTKTVIPEEKYNTDNYIYFVDTLGNLCNAHECVVAVGAGIRPVVTISSDNIKYLIRTKTDGNGTIEVVDSAFGGESISFRVSAKKGLKLSGLTIITDAGEKVEFREEDLTTNNDGTISISTNKFTMPYENVTIEARWSSGIINPNTGTGISVIIIAVVLFVSSITCMLLKQKKNYIMK